MEVDVAYVGGSRSSVAFILPALAGMGWDSECRSSFGIGWIERCVIKPLLEKVYLTSTSELVLSLTYTFIMCAVIESLPFICGFFKRTCCPVTGSLTHLSPFCLAASIGLVPLGGCMRSISSRFSSLFESTTGCVAGVGGSDLS